MGTSKFVAMIREFTSGLTWRNHNHNQFPLLKAPPIVIVKVLYSVFGVISIAIGLVVYLKAGYWYVAFLSLSFLAIAGHAYIYIIAWERPRLQLMNGFLALLLALFASLLSYISIVDRARKFDSSGFLFQLITEAMYLCGVVVFLGSLLVLAAKRYVVSRPYRWFPAQCVAVLIFFAFNRWLVRCHGHFGFEFCYLALAIFSFSLYLTAIGSDWGFKIFVCTLVFWAIGFWFPWLITPAGLEEGVTYSRALQAVIALYFFYGLTFEESKN